MECPWFKAWMYHFFIYRMFCLLMVLSNGVCGLYRFQCIVEFTLLQILYLLNNTAYSTLYITVYSSVYSTVYSTQTDQVALMFL